MPGTTERLPNGKKSAGEIHGNMAPCQRGVFLPARETQSVLRARRSTVGAGKEFILVRCADPGEDA
jgi:hypothetical protein